ncbi:MAG: AbrB family transcriptional regulator, partial [Anaerovoracaceae bacterium]
MSFLFQLLLTIAVGALLGIFFQKIRIPGGLLIGSMAGAAVLNITFSAAYVPDQTKILVQIVAGAFIGCSMEKSDLKRLPKIIRPAAIMLAALFVLNMGAGFLIYAVSPLDLATSLMSAVPGGISDTPIIASDMGADGPKVAVMQLVRQILGIGVFPALIYLWDQKRTQKDASNPSANTEKRQKSKTKSGKAFAMTLLLAAAAGIAGRFSGLPSATFVFPIIVVLILKLKFDYAYIPRWAKKCAQVLSGCYLGSAISFSDVLEMRYLLVPLCIITAGYMLNCCFTGLIISRTCGFSRKEGMLITTPAGASDMALIAADLGVENTDIVILQVIRAVVVMTVFPQIIGW